MKFLLLIFTLVVAAGCGNNAHYTGGLGATSIGSELALPIQISPGLSFKVAGSCEPNGKGNISIDSSPTGDFTPAPLTCDCVDGAVANCKDSSGSSATNITFPGDGPNGVNPQVVTTVTDPETGETFSGEQPVEVTPEIDLNTPPFIAADGNPVTLTGTCSPDAIGAISTTMTGVTPNTAGPCDCVDGMFSCPAGPFTSVDPNPVFTASFGSATDDEPAPVGEAVTISNDPISAFTPHVISGTCSPNGTGNVDIFLSAGFNPTTAGPCDCVDGAYSCPAVTFTSIPTNPTITAELGAASDDYNPTVEPGVDLTPPGNMTIGAPVTLSGACSPDGNDVTVAIPGATPSSVGLCPCSGGVFTCPAATFSELPANPVLTATGSIGGTDTENTTTDSEVTINNPGPLATGTPTNFTGTCSPDGTGNVSIAIPGAIPASAGPCDCVGGSYSCGPVTFSVLPPSPTITASETSGANGPATDAVAPGVTPAIDLANPDNVTIGVPEVLSGSCSPEGNNVTVAVSGATPSSVGSCPCSGGTFTCPAVTFTNLPASPVFNASGSIGGTDSENTTTDSAVTLTDPGPLDTTNPSTFTGTCSPDGVGNVSVSIPGATPSSAGPCDCVGGSYSCGPVTFSVLPSSPTVTASETSGANGPATDSESPTVTPEIDLANPGNVTIGSPEVLTGSCSPEGNNVTVAVPGATPSTIGSCPCSGGTFTCPSVTFTDLPATVVFNATGSIGGTDTENSSVDSAVTIDNPGPLDTSNPFTFTGTCAPDGTGNVSIAIPGATPASAGPCDCNMGTYSCGPVTFSALPSNPTITASETSGANGPATDPVSPGITSSVDLTNPGNVKINDPITLTGSCVADGDPVNITIADATPGSVGPCPCTGGTFTCPSATFTELPANPSFVAANSGANDTENTTTDSEVTINNPGPLDTSNPFTFSGTCSPDGTGNVSIAIPGATPASAGPCDCVGGSYSCVPVTFSVLPPSPTITASETSGANGPASDPVSPGVTEEVDLNPPTLTTGGSATNLTGACSPDGTGTITIDIPGATPNSAGPCDCVAGNFSCPAGPFTSLVANQPVTANNGAASDTENSTISPAVDLTNPGNVSTTSPVVLSGSCTADGDPVTVTIADATPGSVGPCPCTAGTFTCPSVTFTELPASPSFVAANSGASDTENTTTDSAVDLADPGPIDTVSPTTLTGTCAPDGTGNVSIALAAGFMPSTTGPCDCVGGNFTCPAVTFTSIPATPTITASETSGANGPATDSETPTITPEVDLDQPTITIGGSATNLTGSCSPDGVGTITIDITGATPSSAGPCNCSGGSFSCPAGPFTSLDPNQPVTANNGTATDTENSIVTPAVDLSLSGGPFDVGSNIAVSNFSGSCAPNTGSPASAAEGIEISNPNMSPSTIFCECSNGSIDTSSCVDGGGSSVTDVTFDSTSDPSLTVELNDGLGGSASDPTPPAADISPVVSITPGPSAVNVGDDIPIQGSCESAGDMISVPNPDPANLSPAGPLTCACTGNPGTFSCGQYTVTNLGTGSNTFTATIQDSDGESNTGSIAVPYFSSFSDSYSSTGADQSVTIPVGAKKLTVKAWGSGGGGGRTYGTPAVINQGGPGGFSEAEFDVSDLSSTGATTLVVVVGEGGLKHSSGASGAAGVYYNGGGAPDAPTALSQGASGGGLVGLFDTSISQANALIISGSGGGASVSNGNNNSGAVSYGGIGGTHTLAASAGSDSNQNGTVFGGGAGTQVSGGVGGGGFNAGSPGFVLSGGDSNKSGFDQSGGGGGAGYFGGGGSGSTGTSDAAGGGGSGFIAGIGTIITESVGVFGTLDAPNNSDPDYVAGVGEGGDVESDGGDGLIVISWE